MNEDQLKKYISEEVAKTCAQKMSDPEKMSLAKDFMQIGYDGAISAGDHAAEVSTEFIRLEVQIAALLFVLLGFFVGDFVGNASPLAVFWAKVTLSISVFSLIVSLLMGLLHLKREEMWWDEIVDQRQVRFLEWRKVGVRETSFEQAAAFHRGTSLNKGNVISVPAWTWIMQSIFLGIGITTLFVLFLAYIFLPPVML